MNSNSMRSWFFGKPTTGDFVVVLTFLFALTPIIGFDIWWHLAIGREICETASIPKLETFSYTSAGKHWIAHEWLTDFLYYTIFRACGYQGLVILRALFLAITLAILYRLMVLSSDNPLLCFVLYFFVAAAHCVGWVDRPQIFSMLMFVLFVKILSDSTAIRSRAIYYLPPLMALWANLHGAYVLGLLLIALTLIGELLQIAGSRMRGEVVESKLPVTLAVVLLLTTLSVLVNPCGVELLLYPMQYAGNSIHTRFIAEWKPPQMHQLPFFEVYLVLVISAFIISRKPKHPRDLLYLLVFGHFSLSAMRSIPFFVLATAAGLAEHLSIPLKAVASAESVTSPLGVRLHRSIVKKLLYLTQMFRDRDRGSRPTIISFILLIVLATLFQAGLTPFTAESVEWSRYPVAAVERIKQLNHPGKLFALYDWGGYLIWNLYPRTQVFIDGRADVHGEKIIEEYHAISECERGWRERLTNWGISMILVKPDCTLAKALRDDGEWRLDYEDASSELFIKTDAKLLKTK